MLKLELLVGVKLVQAEPLLLLDGMDTGGVAWGHDAGFRTETRKRECSPEE